MLFFFFNDFKEKKNVVKILCFRLRFFFILVWVINNGCCLLVWVSVFLKLRLKLLIIFFLLNVLLIMIFDIIKCDSFKIIKGN